jgi:5'-nucleotidase
LVWAASPRVADVPRTGFWPPPQGETHWTSTEPHGAIVRLRLLGFNDFHGNLQPPTRNAGRPVGGAAALAAYLEAAEHEDPGRTLILHAGDHLGASPPITRLLANEPAIQFLNLLANPGCRPLTPRTDAGAAATRCNVVGTLGNHEFDAGVAEIRRLLYGGNAASGPYLEAPYRGSRVPYVCANVRDRTTGRLLLPPSVIVHLGGIPVGIIGAVVRQTPTLVPAWATRDLEFLDEADSINAAAAQLKRRGVRTLVVLIHQGLTPVVRSSESGGAAEPGEIEWGGPLRDIVAKLDEDIDVVISGHTHSYTNALLPNRGGRAVLVTQAYSYGVAYADIELIVDRATHDVVSKSARIVPVWDDAGPGLYPDERVASLTAAAAAAVESQIATVVTTLGDPITRAPNPAGESALGDLVADAQRSATGADFALMNPGGLRADLHAGPITRGDILTVQPFANRLVTVSMSGARLREVLEQQWPDASRPPLILKTSGLREVWDNTRPAGARIVTLCTADHHPVDPDMNYRVTVNDFLLGGGDGFTRLRGLDGKIGPLDSDALERFLASFNGTAAHTGERVVRADLGAGRNCSP